jgi:hypothetical protein
LAKPVAVPNVDSPVAPDEVLILAEEEEKPTPFAFWAVPIAMMNMWLEVIAPKRQQGKGGDALALHHPSTVQMCAASIVAVLQWSTATWIPSTKRSSRHSAAGAHLSAKLDFPP